MGTMIHREEIEKRQTERLRRMLASVLRTNEFYRRKFAQADAEGIESLAQMQKLPFTRKSELVEDQKQHPPFGSDLTSTDR